MERPDQGGRYGGMASVCVLSRISLECYEQHIINTTPHRPLTLGKLLYVFLNNCKQTVNCLNCPELA
jgi:hypothetical protein